MLNEVKECWCYNEETRREIHGQVAQLVERSPEKAGVGGSTPSLATIIPKDLCTFAAFIQPKV